MAWKTLLSECAGWLQDANTMLVSAFCHLSLLLAVALLSFGGSGAAGDRPLVVHLGSGQDSAANVDPLDGDDALKADNSLAANDSPVPDKAKLDAAIAPTAAIGATQLVAESAIGALQIPEPMATPTKPGARTGASGGLGLALGGLGGGALGGGKGGDGSSTKAATEFFGIGGYGQTFVYVVDCSDSMNADGKFERARYELLQSIEKLNHDQKYFVIFYNHRAHPMDGEKPVLATESHVSETTRWINDVEATGGTNPLPALLYALSMRPDAIYFLSDGQFDPQAIRELRIRNRPNLRLRTQMIPIHTIAFVDRVAEGLMRTIARNSGGEYRFVK